MYIEENKETFKFERLSFEDLYHKHRRASMNFMRQMIDEVEDILDIYQDAVIVLYINSLRPDFQLTCSIQTYLNSICRNQILKRIPKSRKMVRTDDFEDGITDWFEEYNEERETKLIVIEDALKEMKSTGGHCYALLHGFFFLKMSMKELALNFNFGNKDSAKTQKAKCQKKLKEIVLSKYSKS